MICGFEEHPLDKQLIMEELKKLKSEITGNEEDSLHFCLEVLRSEREEKKKYKAKANEHFAKDWFNDIWQVMMRDDWVYEDYHEEMMREIIADKSKLKKENEELKKKVEEIPSLLEEERYKERAENERDWEDKEEEERLNLESEIEELKEKGEKLREKVIDCLAGSCEDRIDMSTICDWFGIFPETIEERVHDRMIENMSPRSDDE